MYLAIIVLPLLGSIVSGFFGRKVGVSGAQLITCLCVIITTFMAILAFVEVALNNIPVYLSLFRWIDSESVNVLWAFNFDSLTVSMLIPVLIISSLVHIYSIGYMGHDPHNQRFFSYLSLFTFMMIILVTANSFLLMFVGWEGVGICSYLLVSFWFTRIAANQSSMSAFLTNRIGDCFLTLGMFVIIRTFGNLDYSVVFSLAPYVNENIIVIIGICLLIGAMAKSSQIGLHVWLPLAMEGPTPVSALIHAATMVTAGVYLLMRLSPLIEYSTTVLLICLWVGSITTVFSSLIGLFQQDIKKVIAYSTMSQLGMMVIAIGISSYNIALFHLVNHAFYKGLLFLGAGAVIHAVADNQDFRKYGALLAFLPLTYTVMLIASLSLIAFPFMTGFYSKDLILETSFGLFKYSSFAVYFIAVTGAMFTTLYSVKVLYLTFITNPSGSLASYKNAHEGDIFMSLPLVILALFSVSFGFLTSDIFKGLGYRPFADNSLFIHPSHEIMLNTDFGVTTLFKILPFILTIISIITCTYILEVLPRLIVYFKYSRFGYNLFNFFSLRFLIEFIYNRLIVRYTLNLGGQTTKILDKGSVELVGPYGIQKRLLKLSDRLSKLDTGVITSYALYILTGLILYMLLPYVFYYDFGLLLLIIYTLYTVTEDNKDKRYTFANIPVPHNTTNSLLHAGFDFKPFSNGLINKLISVLIIAIISFFVRRAIIYSFDLDSFNSLIDYLITIVPSSLISFFIMDLHGTISDLKDLIRPIVAYWFNFISSLKELVRHVVLYLNSFTSGLKELIKRIIYIFISSLKRLKNVISYLIDMNLYELPTGNNNGIYNASKYIPNKEEYILKMDPGTGTSRNPTGRGTGRGRGAGTGRGTGTGTGTSRQPGFTYPDVPKEEWNNTWPNKAKSGQHGDGWYDKHNELRSGDNHDPKWVNADDVNPNNPDRRTLPNGNKGGIPGCLFDVTPFLKHNTPEFWASNQVIPIEHGHGRTKGSRPYQHGGDNWPTQRLMASALEFRDICAPGTGGRSCYHATGTLGQGDNKETYAYLNKKTFNTYHQKWLAAWLKEHRPDTYRELMENADPNSPSTYKWSIVANTEKLRSDINRTR